MRPRGPNQANAAIGARLRSFRRGKKMSQAELGKSLGVTFQQIQKYENGKNRLSGDRLVTVCETLHITPAQLLGFNGGHAIPVPNSVDAHSRRAVAWRPPSSRSFGPSDEQKAQTETPRSAMG